MGIRGFGVIPIARMINANVATKLVFLLNDKFTTAEAAPLASPRTAEPGPGYWDVSDSENVFSISSVRLNFTAPTASRFLAYSNAAGAAIGITRAVGLCIMHVILRSSGTTISAPSWSSVGTSIDDIVGRVNFGTSTQYTVVLPGGTSISTGAIVNSVEYTACLILRTSGLFYFLKGGIYTEWTLMWASPDGTTTPVYAMIGSTNAAGYMDSVRLLDLAAPYSALWADDYGIATERYAGSVSAGQAFTHEANCLLEWVQTTRPTSGEQKLRFRKQDASNYWEVTINSAGSIGLNEIVAGASTNRAFAGNVVSNGHRVVIVADGTTIRGYSNNVLRWTYSSATNFQTATSGELNTLATGGAISDLITWPRTLSGEALTSLEAVRTA